MPPPPAQSLAEQVVEEEIIELKYEANRHPVNYRLLRPLTRSERDSRPGHSEGRNRDRACHP